MEIKLYSVVRGEVVSIKEFGAFVSLEGTKRQGLLHRSAISNHPIDRVSEVLDIGEKIFVKIISNKDGKLGLSMKVVNQTTGEDRDPNNLITAEIEKRKQGAFRTQSPIRLGAELNTVCKRCGVKGHLASSCFSQMGDEFLGLLTSSSEENNEKLSNLASRKYVKKKRHSKRHCSSRNRKLKDCDRSRSPPNDAITKHKTSGHCGRHHRKHHG